MGYFINLLHRANLCFERLKLIIQPEVERIQFLNAGKCMSEMQIDIRFPDLRTTTLQRSRGLRLFESNRASKGREN